MRKTVKWGAMAGLSAAMLLTASVAVIAQDKMAMVTERQDFMKAQGADMKAIVDFSKGAGDKAAALKGIDDLLARNSKILEHFPAGTSADDFPGKTAAKPEIWKEYDKFKMIPPALDAEEVKLKVAIEGGDAKAVGEQVQATVKAGCGACHGAYRLKKS